MTSLIERNGWHRKWHSQNKEELYKHSLIKDFLKRPHAYTIEYENEKLEKAILKEQKKQLKLL